MSQVMARPSPVALDERLARGADFLFDLERRGEVDAEYQVWLDRWLEMLAQYEESHAV
jgi:hypothetical protein